MRNPCSALDHVDIRGLCCISWVLGPGSWVLGPGSCPLCVLFHVACASAC